MSTAAVTPAQIAPKPVGHWFEDMALTRRHWAAGFALFIAFVIESWEMMIIIYSSGAIATDFGLSTGQTGSLIGAIFLGMIPGALLWGKLMGVWGRRTCLLISIGAYTMFPLLSAVAPTFEILLAIRFACGVVLAGALVVTFPYFTELVPVKMRGRATVYLSAGWPLGVLIAVGVTIALQDQGWRWVVGFSSVAGLWALVIASIVPESPYWLAEKGRAKEAEDAIRQLSMQKIQPVISPTDQATAGKMPFSRIFSGPRLKVTVVQTIINFCFSWGYWGLASWMPALLAERGLSAPQGLGFIALSALFMFPGYICASFLTGRFGRRRVLLTFVFFSAVCGMGFAYSDSMTQMYGWNFGLSFFMLGGWGVWNTWLSEIYDTPSRGAGTAWGVSAQRVANAIAPVVIGAMLATSTFGQTVLFITAFLAITFIAALFLKEMEGKPLS
ncbi:MAG: MFS transporter [Lysobacterales bacterium]